MNHLVVFAHPRPGSFIRQLVGAYIDELERCGHAVTVRDLYGMCFDPVLSEAELADPGTVLEDVRAEQALIRAAHAITFAFPIWWSSMPAILKGYVDRVFTHGFAWRMRGETMEGGLTGRKGVLITSSGAPMEYLVESGEMRAFTITQDKAIMELCGLSVVARLHCAGIGPGTTSADVDAHLARVRKLVADHF